MRLGEYGRRVAVAQEGTDEFIYNGTQYLTVHISGHFR
jgi:hypothetical protein